MPDEEQPQTRIRVFTNEWQLIESGTHYCCLLRVFLSVDAVKSKHQVD